MLKPRYLIALILTAMLCGFTKAQNSIDGVYGVLCVHNETGDWLGTQVKVSSKDQKTQFEVLVCEGGCVERSVFKGVSSLNSGAFAFSAVEHLTDQDHHQLEYPVTFSGVFRTSDLKLRARGKSVAFDTVTLKPTRQARCPRGMTKGRQPLLEGWPRPTRLTPR